MFLITEVDTLPPPPLFSSHLWRVSISTAEEERGGGEGEGPLFLPTESIKKGGEETLGPLHLTALEVETTGAKGKKTKIFHPPTRDGVCTTQ